MAYKYDIFISYKRDEDVLEWLQKEFVPVLRKRIQSYYSDCIRIYLDADLRGGAIPKHAVMDALKHSKIIIPILAPPYFQSPWCSAEWKTFEQREAAIGLLDNTYSLRIPIRLVDCENYGDHMGADSPIPYEFHDYRHTGDGWRNASGYHSFSCAMNELSETIVQRLQQVKEFDDTWPLVSHEEAGPLCPKMCHSLHARPTF